nr:MAG TPA: hypothetical protein [Caudoviricetes sp.]
MFHYLTFLINLYQYMAKCKIVYYLYNFNLFNLNEN